MRSTPIIILDSSEENNQENNNNNYKNNCINNNIINRDIKNGKPNSVMLIGEYNNSMERILGVYNSENNLFNITIEKHFLNPFLNRIIIFIENTPGYILRNRSLNSDNILTLKYLNYKSISVMGSNLGVKIYIPYIDIILRENPYISITFTNKKERKVLKYTIYINV